jgi:hypothetical protein
VYPNFAPTPYDNVTIEANVTLGMKNVTLYFRIGSPGLTFNGTSDYKKDRMHQFPAGGWTWWDYTFDKQPARTTIYFFLEAVDSYGVVSTWPGTFPDFRFPRIIDIEEPGQSRLYDAYLYLNDLRLSDRFLGANITVHLAGYIPNFPEQGSMSGEVNSNIGHGIGFQLPMQGETTRFYYIGEASGFVDLNGRLEDEPYSNYSVSITITIRHRIANFSDVDQYPIPVYTRSFSMWDMWDISSKVPHAFLNGNNTEVHIDFSLTRRISPYYPPLILMLTTFGVLGLIPLVSRFHKQNRYDLFLNAIILASSAELSQTIYPFGGILQSNVFLLVFALILFSAVVMMAVSSLPDEIREWSSRGAHLEVFTTTGIIIITSAVILNTSLPWWSKPLAVGLESLGTIVFLFHRLLSRLLSSRLRNRTIRKTILST